MLHGKSDYYTRNNNIILQRFDGILVTADVIGENDVSYYSIKL